LISYRPSDKQKEKLQKFADERMWSLNKAVTYIVNQHFENSGKNPIKGKGMKGQILDAFPHG